MAQCTVGGGYLAGTGAADRTLAARKGDFDDHPSYDEFIQDHTHVTGIIEPDPDSSGSDTSTTILDYAGSAGSLTALEAKGELITVTDANEVETRYERDSAAGLVTRLLEGPTGGGATTYFPVDQRNTRDYAGRAISGEQYNGTGTGIFDVNDNPTSEVCEPCDCFYIISGSPQSCTPMPGFVNNVEGGQWEFHLPEPDYPSGFLPFSPQWFEERYVPMPACTDSEEFCSSSDFDKMRNLLKSEHYIKAVDTYDLDENSSSEFFTSCQVAYRKLENSYDALYRLREQTISTTEPTVHLGGTPPLLIRTFEITPDANGNTVSVEDPDGNVIEYTYDDANRLLAVKRNSTTLVTYAYYNTGMVHTATNANGTSTTWTYDDALRPNTIAHKRGTTVTLALDYDWTADGLVDSIAVSPEGVTTYHVYYAYDNRNRLINEQSLDAPAALQFDLTYTYDELGNRLTKTDGVASPDIVTTYHYDTDASPPFTWTTRNNRLMFYEVMQGETLLEKTWYAYNRGGQAKMIVNQYPQVDEDVYHVRMLQYNLAQQLWLVRKYTYDAAEGSPNSENVTPVLMREFRYDGDRQRYLERTHAASDFAYDPDLDVWHDYLGNAAWADYNVLTPSSLPTASVLATHDYGVQGGAGGSPALVRTLDTSGTKYFHADMLGSTRLITDGSGSTTAALNYTAFGELQPLGNPSLGQGMRYGYAGAWGYQNDALADADNDIGLLHVGARYYDPSIGRFVMRDPIGIWGGMNVYGYCSGEPVGSIDPDGLMSI